MVAPFHERVKRVFYEASRRAPAARAAFLDEACGGVRGDAVRAEVESLLAFYREAPPEAAVRSEGAAHGPRRRFPSGRIIGRRYRIDGLLGRGGVGEVYRAWDVSLETWVALKVLVMENPLARAELVREVCLARQVTHPAVCRVYDIHEEESEIFFTMEWIDGERLDALLEREGRLAPDRVVDLGRQLCAGVAAAHAKGIIHRDLKPGNVLVDREDCAHVTDFGTAVSMERPTLRDLLPIGTPRYMAPEQLQEGGEISARTDVHALGLLLHEMLTSARPRPGRRPRALRLLRPDVGPWLAAVIQRALSEDPAKRYPSAAELGLALSCDVAAEAGRIVRRLRSGCLAQRPEPGVPGAPAGSRYGGSCPAVALPDSCPALGASALRAS